MSTRLTLKAFAFATCLAVASTVFGIGFLPSVEELPDPDVVVVTTDGREIAGRIENASFGTRGLKKITLREYDGPKYQLDAAQIRHMTVPLRGPGALLSEATTTLEKAAKTDYRQLVNTHELVYESLAFPEKDRRLLLPLVNPGFDREIQVYGLINSREGTTRIAGKAFFGDEPKAYVVVKNGGEPMRVEKGEYKKVFLQLFGDCPDLVQRIDKSDRDWSDFADHVLAYETSCP